MGAVTFEIKSVNVIRLRRDVSGVRMNVFINGKHEDCVWMSAAEIRDNIKTFGDCDAFRVGLECYRFSADMRETAGGAE